MGDRTAQAGHWVYYWRCDRAFAEGGGYHARTDTPDAPAGFHRRSDARDYGGPYNVDRLGAIKPISSPCGGG